MFTQRILDLVQRYFELDSLGCYTSFSDLREIAVKIALIRMAGVNPDGLIEQVRVIAGQHAATLTVPDNQKCYHLNSIAWQFAALGELFRIDLLPLIRLLLLEGLQEFAEVQPVHYIIGPKFPERGSELRGDALKYYCQISHFAHVDISSQITDWRSAIVQHLEQNRKQDMTEDGLQQWQAKFQKEMDIIDGIIAGYKPMPGTRPL